MTAQERFAAGHQVMGRYEIVRHIATGGMGTVWEARDLALEQTVALKHVSFATVPGPDAEQTRQRTLREARFAAQLRGHPHVVSIYDVQELDGDVWLVLEYLPSQSLADITDHGVTLPVDEVARIGAAVADALAAAHLKGITHRDVKPGNVLLSFDDGEVKLTDFGISHAEGEHPLTATNIVSGTPAYMSREVARGDDETPASDIFSLGATLYKAVEGQPPFGNDVNSRRMLQRVANGRVETPRRAGHFAPLLMRLLELDPNTRPDAALAHRLLDDFARRFRNPTQPSSATLGPPVSENLQPFATTPADSTLIPGEVRQESSPPRRFHRRSGVLIGAAALLVLALGASLVWINRGDPTAIPTLPEAVSTLTLAGDPKAANPCALFDPTIMQRFGGTTDVGIESDVGECSITNLNGSSPIVTDAHYSTTSSETPLSPAPRKDLGGITIIPEGITTYGCSSYIQLPDSTQITLNTHPQDLAKSPPPNACEINKAALAIAVDRLATVGITYTPGWQGDISLAAEDACTLPGDSLSQIPALAVSQRVGPPGGAYCYIGSQQAGQPFVIVDFGLQLSGQMSGYGAPGTADGNATYTRSTTPTSQNSSGCMVYFTHRPSYDGGASGPAEWIAITVEGPQPREQLCQQATTIGIAAERNTND